MSNFRHWSVTGEFSSSTQPLVLKLKLVFNAWPCSGRISTDPGVGPASTMKGSDLRRIHGCDEENPIAFLFFVKGTDKLTDWESTTVFFRTF